jgi:hypothetical protein
MYRGLGDQVTVLTTLTTDSVELAAELSVGQMIAWIGKRSSTPPACVVIERQNPVGALIGTVDIRTAKEVKFSIQTRQGSTSACFGQ